jgi:cytochrome c peroxidase
MRRNGSHAHHVLSAAVALSVACAALGCEGAAATSSSPESTPEPAYAGPPIPWSYAAFPAVDAPEPVTPEKVSLGTALFYDPVLSSDGTVACATCHSELWGMSDGLPVSVGVGGVGAVGPGRTGPNVTTRNALTLWNAAFRSALFWDGREPTLEKQAFEPLEHPNEMNQPADVGARRVAAISGYVALFDAAYPGQAITEDTLVGALSTFERTLVSSHAPYDQYVGGDANALSAEEQRGMQVFADAACPSCHAPPLFESATFVRRFDSEDPGRFAVTNDPKDLGAFRVPTLRNLRDGGPYFHDGSESDFDAAVQAEVDREVAAGRAKAPSDDDFAALVAFLYSSLEDRANDPARPQTVPSGLPVPADGDRITR